MNWAEAILPLYKNMYRKSYTYANSMEFKSESIYCRHKIHENWKRSLSNPIHIPLFPYKSNAHHDDQFSTCMILTPKSNLTLSAHHSGVDVWYGLCTLHKPSFLNALDNVEISQEYVVQTANITATIL